MSSARSPGSPSRLARGLQGIREGVRIALDSVRLNPFRSGLTILGIGIGVCVVVLIASLITGIRGTVQEEVEAVGPRNFFVTRFDVSEVRLVGDGTQPDWLRRPPITVNEARRVNELSSVESAVISFGLQDPTVPQGGVTVIHDGTTITGVTGAAESDQWPLYRRVEFVEGRNFVAPEVEAGRAVIVLSDRLARELFGSAEAAGRRVRVSLGAGSVPFTVVGVARAPANVFADQVPHWAVVPYTAGIRRLGGDDQWGQMVVVPREGAPLEAVEDEVITLMRSLRGLAPGVSNDFSILRSTQLLDLFDRFTAVFFMVMLALSSVGLLVGGVGVIGIMLISVTERTREIGIRKALGATRGEILWQFLVEAGMLTLLGGAAGLLLGGGGAWLVDTFTPVPASIPLWSVGVSLAAAALTGMLFGLIPAVRAARMEPVDALRFE